MPRHTTPPLLRTALLLGATTALVGGLGVVAAQPARADTPETEITELSLAAPARSGGEQRTTTRSQDQTSSGQEEVGAETVLAELPEQRVEQFSTLGVTWDAGAEGPGPTVQYRTRTDGRWTDWATAEDTVSGGDGEDPGAGEDAPRTGTDPIYVGASDGVQVRLTGSADTRVEEPKVALIAAEETPADASIQTTAAQAAAPGLAPRPAYISRKGWGADESMKPCGTDTDDTIQGAIVHHTAGVNSYTKAQSASIVRGIYAYHTQTLGWCDIGYNFLVDKYGQVFEGRSGGVDHPVHGAHATSWNTDTVGISFMGNYETATAPTAMLEAGAKVLAWKFDAYYRDPLSKVTLAGKYINRISGHGDVMATACPGRNIRSKMTWLRERVDTLVGSRSTPNYQRWQALGGDKGQLGSPYIGEAVHVDGRVTKFRGYDLFSSDATGSRWTKGGIRTKYRSMGAARSDLGFPTGDESSNWPLTGIQAQRFEDGLILWSSATGAHSLMDGFQNRYESSSAIRRALGAPSTDEQTSGWGVASQTFVAGRMFWVGGARIIDGEFFDHYAAMSGSARLKRGYPVADERLSGDVLTQQLSRSTFYLIDGDVIEVTGALNEEYRSLGAETGRLGFPTASVRKDADGNWYSSFEHGTLTQLPDGTVEVRYS
ncbi:hypothetical protein GC722_13805 [Auraticoccus sp. F435]|uniref:Peptidoglycan recognition protein family domain-containing protein n=1 Tax=Auraticoccus cholistanensis TaxID=2656650 RepID=A0A6A9UWI0_9ACTN|nr:N-acetylmuramoyl-L-alanine amidase [Auraticoccus cholistanensis]MVA77091.1 hypothetical protein [Auraticoccus cholistanensis]